MPFLLVFAFVPAVLVIALSVMLISACIMFLTNRTSFTVENLSRVGFKDMFDKCSQKIKDFKRAQNAKKVKTVETIEIVVLKEK